MLYRGADLHATASNGQTALHIAASASENPEGVELLLDRGADIHVADNDSETPIHRAARYNEDPAVVKLLLDNGADVQSSNGIYGWTPLQWAARYNEEPSVMELLLDYGADEIGNTACSLSEANLEMRENVSSTEVIPSLLKSRSPG